MMNTSFLKKPTVNTIVIAGPTASGKTEYAIKLAKQMNGEIISADSRQVYQKLNIGTGKPTPTQLKSVRHHMISYLPPTEILTADKYALVAEQIMRDIQQRGKLCIIVGGTGLWIRALIDGLASLPAADQDYRRELKQAAQENEKYFLYKKLCEVDPDTAARLHPADTLRIIRALEIFHISGIRASYLKKQSMQPSKPALWLGLDIEREILYDRAEQRIDQWISQGWLNEVRILLNSNISPETPALQAIGYTHLVKYIQENYSFEKAIELIKRDTRRYIKRQLTWFRAEKRIQWISQDQDIRRFLYIRQ